MKLGQQGFDDGVPTVLLPVETIVRELDSKLVTAAALARHGCRVVVGHKEAVTFIGKESGPLVWQGKNLFSDKSDDHMADHLLRRGSAIMYLQDEGGIFQAAYWRDTVIQKHHVSELRKRTIDRICLWGDAQLEVIREEAPEVTRPLRVTGTPRFDICKPEFDFIGRETVHSLREQHGPYILVCTRFGAIAHADGIHDAFRRKLNPKIWPAQMPIGHVVDLWFTKWHQDVMDFADFVVFTKALAEANPAHTVILRPHPSESMRFYEQAYIHSPNVVVSRDGSVLNWIRGAELVVHSNCTTGIESMLAGRPTLNYLPTFRDRTGLDVEVAGEAGTPAGSCDEALAIAQGLLAGTQPPRGWSDHARHLLYNLHADAIPRLVEESLVVLRERSIGHSRLVFPGRERFRQVVRRMLGRPALRQSAYIASKRGPFERDYCERILDGCRTMGIGGGRIREFASQFIVIDP